MRDVASQTSILPYTHTYPCHTLAPVMPLLAKCEVRTPELVKGWAPKQHVFNLGRFPKLGFNKGNSEGILLMNNLWNVCFSSCSYFLIVWPKPFCSLQLAFWSNMKPSWNSGGWPLGHKDGIQPYGTALRFYPWSPHWFRKHGIVAIRSE